MRHVTGAVLAVLLAVAVAAPAVADGRHQRPSDRVVLTLTAEEWVETETAQVRVAVDSAMSEDEAALARSRVMETLARLAADVDWHVTGFNRSRDATGLERWHLEAEARVPEPGLDGLYGRAKEASRPGEQVTVLAIDFTPTLADREKVIAGLRSEIYAQAKAELGRLNAVYPDRDYRVKMIDFTGVEHPPRPYRREAMMMEAPAAEMAATAAPAPIGVAQRVQLRATVVLAVPGPKQEGREKEED